MNKKVIISLILFVGIFFAFGMKANAYDCIYYQFTDSKNNPDANQRLEIKDYGNNNGGTLILNGEDLLAGGYWGEWWEGTIIPAYKKMSFIGESIATGNCPPYVKVTINVDDNPLNATTFNNAYFNAIASTLPNAYITANGYERKNLGTFVVSREETTAPIAAEGSGIIDIGGDPVENTCDGILGEDFIDFLNDYIFTPLKIVAPVLLLIFTTLDFSKAVFADDKDSLKKAQSKFIKRTAAVIILFLLAYILDLIFTVIANGTIDVCI